MWESKFMKEQIGGGLVVVVWSLVDFLGRGCFGVKRGGIGLE